MFKKSEHAFRTLFLSKNKVFFCIFRKIVTTPTQPQLNFGFDTKMNLHIHHPPKINIHHKEPQINLWCCLNNNINITVNNNNNNNNKKKRRTTTTASNVDLTTTSTSTMTTTTISAITTTTTTKQNNPKTICCDLIIVSIVKFSYVLRWQ